MRNSTKNGIFLIVTDPCRSALLQDSTLSSPSFNSPVVSSRVILPVFLFTQGLVATIISKRKKIHYHIIIFMCISEIRLTPNRILITCDYRKELIWDAFFEAPNCPVRMLGLGVADKLAKDLLGPGNCIHEVPSIWNQVVLFLLCELEHSFTTGEDHFITPLMKPKLKLILKKKSETLTNENKTYLFN